METGSPAARAGLAPEGGNDHQDDRYRTQDDI